MDVVIVPSRHEKGVVYEHNRVWARQFVNANPESRAIVEMGVSNPQEVVKVTLRAVRLAGREGQVIYAVGHGGVGTASSSGMADLAPRKKMRITQFVAFFDVTTAWSGSSVRAMERELKAAEAKRSTSARSIAKKRWCQDNILHECALARERVKARSQIQPYYNKIAEIYHQFPVKRIVLLVCNVGKSDQFLNEMSTDFGVPVAAFTRSVESRSKKEGGHKRVWMYLDGDPEGSGTNTDASLTEILPNRRLEDGMEGRIIKKVDDKR